MSAKKFLFFCLALAKGEFQQPTMTISLTRKTRSGQPVTPFKNDETDNYAQALIAEPAAMNLLSMDTNDTAVGNPVFHVLLTNYLDYQYYGALYVGSNYKYYEYIFDTGSPWLWLPTTECVTCQYAEQTLYDTASSTSYQQQKFEEDQLDYNTGSVRGYLSTESFCLSENSTYCVDDQQFIAVTETSELDFLKSDGILGLAPSNVLEST